MAEESGDEKDSVGTDGDDGDIDDLDVKLHRPPPPPPLCVLRAHSGDVQAVAFGGGDDPADGGDLLLYSGDSEGLLRAWDVEDRRPVCSSSSSSSPSSSSDGAIRLHPPEGGVLGLRVFPSSSSSSSNDHPLFLLSQGREGTLKLWRLGEAGREVVVDGGDDDDNDSNPSSSSSSPRPLATTETGSKGFCVLSAVEQPEASTPEAEEDDKEGEDDGDEQEEEEEEEEQPPSSPPPPLYVAVASEDAASVRVFDARRGGADPLCELSEAEAAAAPAPAGEGGEKEEAAAKKTSRGMAMAVALFFVSSSLRLELCALVGYEDGSVVLWRCLKEEEEEEEGEEEGEEDRERRRRRRRRRRKKKIIRMRPAVEALASLRIHFDAVTALAGPVSSSGEGDEGKKLSLPLPLRFFSGGADSVLASYEVRVEGAEEEEEGEGSNSPADAAKREKEKEKKKKKKKAPSMTLVAGPAAKLPARGVGALAVSQRGAEETLVAAGGWDGTIRLLALKKESEEGVDDVDDSTSAFALEPLGELEHHVAPVASLCFGSSPIEGELLASGGRDGSIALWAGLV